MYYCKAVKFCAVVDFFLVVVFYIKHTDKASDKGVQRLIVCLCDNLSATACIFDLAVNFKLVCEPQGSGAKSYTLNNTVKGKNLSYVYASFL